MTEHGPAEADEDEAQGLTRLSGIAVFVAVLLGVGVLFGLVVLAMGLPACEDPDVAWVPCIGP